MASISALCLTVCRKTPPKYLARNKGQVFSKEQIYEAVFSLEGDSDNSTISTHIKNIRSKLNKLDIQPIATVWGIGYKWE